MPIPCWSSRSLLARWSAEFDAPSDGIVTQLREVADRQLAGTATNPLSFDLHDCLLVHDRWVYPLGTMRPGQAKSLTGTAARDLKVLLTRQEFIEGRTVSSPWNPESVEVDRIAWLMMFYTEINGRAYTGLDHRHASRIDSSRLPRLNRAILVGKSPSAPDALLRDGAPISTDSGHSTIFYRIVFPVATEGGLNK
jgi:hypothetical protein